VHGADFLVEINDGRYWLFFAGPYRQSKNPPQRCGYWVGVAYADRPPGPCTKDARGQILLGGHISVFSGRGDQHWFAYRGEASAKTRGRLCIDPFTADPDGRSER
jgi:hypothetical protein